MKKKYKCPYCGFALTGKENQCPNCRNTLTPAVAPDPERKKKALITLGIVLGSLLVLTILALWYFRVWPFRPRLDNAAITAEIGSPEDFLNLAEIPAPSDEQMAALSKYVEKLEVQQKHRLDITDRRGAKKIQILTAALSQDDPDIEQLIKDLGGKITYESGKTGETESKVPAVFLHLPQSPFSGTRLTGTTAVIGLPALFYSEADSDGDAESTDEEANPEGESEESVVPEGVETEGEGSDEELVTTLPAEQLHSARIRVGLSKDILICPACRHENPKDAVVCEKCGAKLQSAPNYVEVDPIEPDPQVIAGGGMSEEQREALMLSNLSNVLLMSNRSTLSFYMACLACEEDPQSVSAVVSLVTHLRMHGYLEEALDVCVIGLQMDPQREELYIHAGNIYIQLDNPDAALGYFNRCLTNCGFSGQAYQGMMAAYLQQNNYTEAFRCMIEGARDGYVSGIRLVYDMLKLRGDYWEIAGSVFKNYTVRTLMDFSVNRSGFNPGRELEGKVVDIGACDIPSSPEDWVASAESMLRSGQKYAQDMLVYYKEDIQEIAEIYNILLNAQDLKDLAAGFLKAFGDKYSKEKLTEAERVISYEQEIFWLDILDDYREWKVKDIRDKVEKDLDGSDMEQLFQMMGNILEENKAFLEAHDSESLEDIAAVLSWFLVRVEDNASIAFTSDQSAVIVSKIKNALRQMGNVRNRAYQEIGEVLHDYYMYSNALLSMVADKELYREWRQKIVLNVVGDQAVCIAECCLLAYVCPILAEPYLMIGSQTHEGFLEGGITGKIPRFPKFIISNKPVRPSADMNSDVLIPDVFSISRKVLGLDQQSSEGENQYPELTRIWEMHWMDTHPGVPKSEMPAAPNFNDSYQREKFWNSMNPAERAQYSAILANPDVVKQSVQLDMYCGRGQTVMMFKEEKIGLLNGFGANAESGDVSVGVGADGSASVSAGAFGVESKPDGTLEGSVKLGSIGKVTVDSNKNMRITMKDKTGINLGLAKTGRDVSAYIGKDGDVGGVGVGGTLYGTYSLAKGQMTSGGIKYSAGAAFFGFIGAGHEENFNIVQGISTSSYYIILAGKKHSIVFKSDLSYLKDKDKVEKKNVPGLQEFHR